MSAIWAVFSASRGLQIVALLLTCWGIWEGNNALQRASGRTEGRTEVATAVKEKSDADTKLSEEVRVDVAAGKRGKPDPHRLQSVPAGRKDGAGK